MPNISDWTEDQLAKFIIDVIHHRPESSALMEKVARTEVQSDGKPVGAQRILNFLNGGSEEQTDFERINVPLGKGGLQYDIAETYGPYNVGDWLSVEATTSSPNNIGDTYRIDDVAIVFKSDTPNGHSGGIGLWCHDDVNHIDPIWALTAAGLIYYLAGQQDIGYLQNADFIRYAGGGDILFYTTDGAFPHAGDFNVYTQGTSNDAITNAGNIRLDAGNYNGNQGGDIEFRTEGTPKGFVLTSTGGPDLPNSAGDIGMTAAGDVRIDADGQFLVESNGGTIDASNSGGSMSVIGQALSLLSVNGGELDVQAEGVGGVVFINSEDDLIRLTADISVEVNAGTDIKLIAQGDTKIALTAGHQLIVHDYLTNNPIFTITD